MNPPSEPAETRDILRERIIGMGETSLHKSYYPLLQQRLADLERFRALIDETNDMILVVQIPENRFVDVNHACSVRLGYATARLLAMDPFNLIAPAKREPFREAFSRAAATGDQEKIETDLCTLHGETIPAELLIRFVTFDRHRYGVIVARDISERIRYERELVATQKKLNLINSLTRTEIKSQVFIVRAYLDVLRHIAKHPEEITILDKLRDTTGEIQTHIELAENYQKLGVQTPRWQNFNEILLYALSHLPPIPLTRTTGTDRLEILADPLLEKGLTHLMEYIYTCGGIAEPVRIAIREAGNGLVISLQKAGTGILPEQKGSLFVWAPAKTGGPNLFFIREILDITGISIAETGDPGLLCFEIRVPRGGYRIS
ncbi:PAS domain S-box protein [Methanoregula sp.]|uniref:PAS domain S-box protein n=1 Tax=Methanoregula sp. TaxID=2052170 RepID=UPI002C1D7A15|nr:PAS domain S-box protein [Methanoregula sp.]HVP95545.1 PAS domain S-box protein [Methanoregula sp.]